MAYNSCRVFCATPGDVEPERQAFLRVLTEINEEEAMSKGVFFVAISIQPDLLDKLSCESFIDDHVRACKFYVQILHDTWGPPMRNFERQWDLSAKCAGRAVFFKAPEGRQIEPKIAELKQWLQADEFSDVEDFKLRLRAQLSEWLAAELAA